MHNPQRVDWQWSYRYIDEARGMGVDTVTNGRGFSPANFKLPWHRLQHPLENGIPTHAEVPRAGCHDDIG